MATEEPGIRPVVLYVNGEAVSTLNPLPATGGGGGGGGGIVDQGVGSGLPTQPWTVRISNGAGFLAPLTDAELRATHAVTQSVEDFASLDLRLEPGDVLAIAIRTASSTATVGVSLNWHEE